MRSTIITYIILFISFRGHTQNSIEHWETAVFAKDVWYYLAGTSEPPADWREIDFTPNGWSRGQGGFGYGDNDDRTTILPTSSVYLRISFDVSDLTKISDAVVNADYDDAIIIYLNGHEVARAGISKKNPTHSDFADSKHEAQMINGESPSSFLIPENSLSQYLVEGKNTLSAQVHNISITSSDLSSIVFLSFGIKDKTSLFRTPPSWFTPPEELSSNLPLIVINTGGNTIARSPKIMARMKIIDNGSGEINKVSQPGTDYDGYIGIKIRGNVSSSFPQKPYAIETRDSLGENNNVSLLGMPIENDWALINNYKDRTFTKHSLGYKLSREMGFYAPRSRYCEVVVNGETQGIYMLQETLKRDDNRVDIAKLDSTDIEGDQLTGGYIFKVDYVNDETDNWASHYKPTHATDSIRFIYKEPENDEIQPEQKEYLRKFIREFEEVLYSSDFKDPIRGYRAYIDVPSFINYLLIQEIGQNPDGYKKSCHFHKDKDRNNIRALLHAGPVWDLDWGWRDQDPNSTDPHRGFFTGLEYNRTLLPINPTPVTWMPRLMEDPQFANEVFTTYRIHRKTILKNTYMHSFIDSVANGLGEARNTHFDLWHSMSGSRETYYDEQKEILKDWISRRLIWLDQHLPGDLIDTSDFVPSPVTYIDSSLIVTDTTNIDTLDQEPLHFFPKEHSNFILYPSMVTDGAFNLKSIIGIDEVSIYTLAGIEVANLIGERKTRLTLNVDTLQEGVYLVVTRLRDGSIIIRRVVKAS